ncbi:MAG TPA: cysteine desulfurase [Bacteroidia bacterium]|jgi:cysteine desulfurase/selenocysteine lyase|nr:cysteine desulfurase [Bacteroidia bacterium]
MDTMVKDKAITKELDVENIRKEFPILSVTVHGKPLVYFDNAASSQKPLFVIKAIEKYYETVNSNVHRGVHHLSSLATDQFEAARKTIATHLNARHDEIIYTRGTTEAINLVAFSYGEVFVKEGDEIIISQMEHHSNIVPWQMLCRRKKAVLKYIPITDSGELNMDEYKKLLSAKTKLVAVTHVSNSLGTINPVEEIIALAHAKNIPVLLDGAQAVPHIKVDVKKLDVDFYCFSGHKTYGPTGIGILFGKTKWLKEMVPYQGGGEMIKEVKLEASTYQEPPLRFEAGTPNIEGSIVLATAIDYMNNLGIDAIAKHEHKLLDYATEKLSAIEGLKIVGQAKHKAPVVAFNIEGLHPYDIGVILDQLGIAVRTGHHCTQPIMDLYCIPGTVRASFSFYNTIAEIDTLVEGVKKAIKMLKK